MAAVAQPKLPLSCPHCHYSLSVFLLMLSKEQTNFSLLKFGCRGFLKVPLKHVSFLERFFFFYMSVSKDKVRIKSFLFFQFRGRRSRVLLLRVCALPSVYKAN